MSERKAQASLYQPTGTVEASPSKPPVDLTTQDLLRLCIERGLIEDRG